MTHAKDRPLPVVRRQGRGGHELLHLDLQELEGRQRGALRRSGTGRQCGWLTDKFGVSWQIIPTILAEMLQDKDAEKARRVMQAMLKVVKLDINALKQAYHRG